MRRSEVACRPWEVLRVSSQEWVTFGIPHAASSSGKRYYEVTLDKFGDDPRIGWANHSMQRTTRATTDGVGGDANSWGVDGGTRKLWHEGSRFWDVKRAWSTGDVIGLAADLEAGVLRCSQNGEWTDAFAGVPPQTLYPAFSTR